MPSTRRTDTRRRLLQAGGRLFAEKGFRGATVREICARARVNIAAINYHFGGKRRLYEAVLLDIFEEAFRKHPADGNVAEGARVQDRLFAFVHSFLLRRLDPSRPTWQSALLEREIREHRLALRAIVGRVLRANYARLRSVVEAALGRPAQEEEVHLCAASILGQCLFFGHPPPAFEMVSRKLDHTPAGIERLARHITAFSLAGMRRLRRRAPTAGRRS